MEFPRHDAHVLVAPAGEIHDQNVIRRQLWRQPDTFRHCVRALERGHNAFGPGQPHGRLQGLFIGSRNILRPTRVMQGRMLRPDGGVVQAGGDRVGQRDLASIVLQEVRVGALQHAGASAVEAGGVAAQRRATAARLDADQPDTRLIDKVIERANRIGPATHAGQHCRRQPGFLLQDLLLDLLPDHAMKVTDHGWVRMRAEDAAQQIMRRAHVGDPIPHGFIDGVFQRSGAGTDAADLRPEQAHAVYIQLLTAHIFLAHVDNAFHAEEGAHGRGGYSVLPSAGLGDDAVLAHAARQQSLAEAVVDLVGAGVQQILAFEVNACPAQLPGQALCQVERRRTSGIVPEQQIELGVKDRVSLRLGIGVLQLLERRHKGLWNIAPPVGAKSAGNGVGRCAHDLPHLPTFA